MDRAGHKKAVNRRPSTDRNSAVARQSGRPDTPLGNFAGINARRRTRSPQADPVHK
jgi:hypothetical protein